MAERTLSNYCDEAKELIRADSYDQAIAICRHMLRHYPKYVRAYRLMAEACLEKGEYVEAANLFKRVLGADMEDMVVRVGLGIAFDQQGALDEAIWQLERAFELSPGNAEIRAELQRLYGERDGATPVKLKLTPAALGRLYLREELYQRAIDEFESVLAQDPERADVQVALAQALWWTEQRQDAAKICEEILEQYPHCLKANLILGEILLSTEREVEAQSLLDIARALDPENLAAQSLFRDMSPLAPESVTVAALEQEELEQELEEFGASEPVADSEMEEIPESLAGDGQESYEDEMPDWLRQLREEEQELAAEEEVSAPESQDMPEWLRQLADERASDTAEETEAAAAIPEAEGDEEMSSWLSELAGETAADRGSASPEGSKEPSGEAPSVEEYAASFEASTPAQEADEVAPAQSVSEGQPDEGWGAEDESAEWIAEPQSEPPSESAESQVTDSAEEIPDWLRDLPREQREERPAAWAEEPAEEAMADASWRAQLDRGEGSSGEAESEISPETMDRLRETMPDESASIEEIMAWMERSKALLEEDGIPGITREERAEISITDAEDVVQPVDESELPSWLQEMRPPIEASADAEEAPSEEALEPVAEEDLPSWLRELRPGAEVPGIVATEEREGPPDQALEWSEERSMVAEEEASPEAEISPEELEARAWLLELREEALEEVGTPEADSTEEIPEAEGEEEMPSWLLDLREEPIDEEGLPMAEDLEPTVEEPAGIEAGEEIPAWLQELRAEEAPEPSGPSEEEMEPPAPAESEPHVIEAELPSWLRELRAEMSGEGEIPTMEETRPAPKEELAQPPKEEVRARPGELGDKEEFGEPTRLEEMEGTIAEAEGYGPDQEDVPSWLRELRAQAEKGETQPLMEKAEEAAKEVSLPQLEEEELPSWLRELKAEAAREDIAAAPTRAEEPPGEALAEEEEPVAEEIVLPAVPEEERVAPAALAESGEEALRPEEEHPPKAGPEPGWGVEQYRQYLQRSPRDHDARLTLARVYAETGDLDHAVQHYGELLSYPGMTEEVLNDLETAVESAPDHLATHELLADAYMRAGELKKALDKYRWLRLMITR